MKFFATLLLPLLIVSCNDDKKSNTNACNSTESIDKVQWLEELKESMTDCSCERSIIQGTYQSQTVFFIALTDPLCNGIDTPTLYNCEGIEVRAFTTSQSDQEDLSENVARDTVLYQCKD